ncbi:MAG: hypothetical protein HFI87_00170 [Bacilli bacterium]|nr:hypothetical protein [Bacilli bacterium]
MSLNDVQENVSNDSEIDLDKDFVIDNSLNDNSDVGDISEVENTSSNAQKGTINIENIFERANNNVKEATNIFQKNLLLKQQLEEKIKKFNIDKSNFEKTKELEYEKIKEYKKTAYEKLKQKKIVIEKSIDELKQQQENLNAEKVAFQEKRKQELEKIKEEKQKNILFMKEKKQQLEALERELKAEKESLNEMKEQLKLDRIQCESDKSELANNLIKFNELVGEFTVGIEKFSDEN